MEINKNIGNTSLPILQVKRLSDKAILPIKGSYGAAGYDLFSTENVIIPARKKACIKTGISIALPDETYGRVAPRSGLALKNSIDVGAGVIDMDYRGEIAVILFNHGDQDFEVSEGDRIAQLIVERIMPTILKEVDDLSKTMRDKNGFGSTGFGKNI